MADQEMHVHRVLTTVISIQEKKKSDQQSLDDVQSDSLNDVFKTDDGSRQYNNKSAAYCCQTPTTAILNTMQVKTQVSHLRLLLTVCYAIRFKFAVQALCALTQPVPNKFSDGYWKLTSAMNPNKASTAITDDEPVLDTVYLAYNYSHAVNAVGHTAVLLQMSMSCS